MSKFWRYRDREEYQRRKAGDILRKYPMPEALPERAPREPTPAPMPRPQQDVMDPLTRGVLGLESIIGKIAPGAALGRERVAEIMAPWTRAVQPYAEKAHEIADISWQKWGRPTMGHWVKGMAAHPIARLWMPEEMREPVTPSGALEALAVPYLGATPWGTTQQIVAGAIEKARAGLPPWAGLAEEPERGRELEAQLPLAMRLIGRQVFDPLALVGGLAGKALPGNLGLLYRIVDTADYTAFLLTANGQELAVAGGLMAIGVAARNIPKIKALVKRVVGQATPEVRRFAQQTVPNVRRFMAEEVGAVEIPGKPPGVEFPTPPKGASELVKEAYSGRLAAIREGLTTKDRRMLAHAVGRGELEYRQNPNLPGRQMEWVPVVRRMEPELPEAAPEAMRPMEAPPEEAARLEREAAEAAGQRRLGALQPEAPPKPLWEMNPIELERASAAARRAETGIEARLFGTEGARRYDALQRRANSTTASYEAIEQASAEIQRMEARLTEARRQRLFGVAPEVGHTLDEVEDYRNALESLDLDSPQALGRSLGRVLTRLPESLDPATMTRSERLAYAQMRYVYQVVQERGWDTGGISEIAIRAAAARFPDPEDARYMLQRFLRSEARPPEERLALVPEGLPMRVAPRPGLPDPWTLPRDLYVRATGATDRADVLQAQAQWRTGIEEAYRRGEINLGTRGLSKAADMVIRDLRATAPVAAPVARPVPPGVAPSAEPGVPRGTYRYYTDCTVAPAEAVDAMVDRAEEVSYAVFARNVNQADLDSLAEGLDYVTTGEGLKLQDDYAVSFYRSEYEGKPAYYVVQSAIEHVFVTDRPIRAEPAVAPAARPAVPVAAQPVPGAPGIVGPPVAPGMGAAVVRPPTGVAVPPGPPVQPPLPGAGLPPPSPVTAPPTGPSRLPTVLSNPQITARIRQPDGIRRLMTWAERENVKPLSWLLRHIGIVGGDPPSEAYALWWSIKGTGNTAALAATADLRQYGDVQKLFGAKDMAVEFQGKKLHLLDILEGRHPEFPMTPEQTAFRDAGWALADDQLGLVHGEGIFPPEISFPEGQHYWPRDVMLRRLPNGTIEVGVVQPSPGGKFLTALMKSEHPREFKTAAQGRALGFEYAGPVDSMEFLVQQSYRAIAGQRALDFLVEFIPSRVGKKVRFGEVTLPGVPGRYFKATELAGVRDMLYDTPLSIPEQAANAVSAIGRVPKLLQTVFDAGPVMLQMFGTLTTYPKVWGESVWRAWRSGFDAPSFSKFLAQPDHAATARRYAPEGLILTGHELTEAARGFVGKLPVVGSLVRGGGRVFDNMLTAARILGLEATEYQIKSPTDSAELVRFWNIVTGTVELGAQGITRRQQALGTALLYSYRTHTAAYSLLFDVGQGGLRGKMARRSLGQFAAATFLGYLGLCGLLKQKPRIDPKEGSRWLTIRVGDQYMGIGGPLFMTLRTLAQVVREPEEAQELAWRYVRGRLSPVVGTGIDVFTKRDAIGMPVRTLPQLTKRVITDNLTPIWIRGVVESGAKDWAEYMAVTSAELAGLRTFPVSPARRRNALREELAQGLFQKPWAELNRIQKRRMEQAPDLKRVTEEAQALGRKRETPWALFWADVEKQREPYRTQIAQITQQFRRNELSGNEYREEVQERQMLMARIPDDLRNTRAYKDIAFARPPATNPVDQFIDDYYKIADEVRDPLTGMAEPREIVVQRQRLGERTDTSVVQEAMEYINWNLDPKYVEARDLYYEYMRIPQYIGFSEEQTQAANEAMRKYRAMRRANPLISPEVTRSLLAQQDPRAVVLMEMAYSRRNPARRMFWGLHPLLSVFYSDLTQEEVQTIMPMSQMQSQLPAWAMQGASAGM